MLRSVAAVFAVMTAVSVVALAAESPSAPGPYVHHRNAATFREGQPLVATSYFYWYDAASGMHVLDADGTDALTDHPPTLKGMSYRSVAWHEGQLSDMIDAGIDVVLPVYWGFPGAKGHWSNDGLGPLVEARKRLLAAGKRPPAIGMFYDTSTLRFHRTDCPIDLTTEAGRQWFFATIRDCYSLIPPEHRACIGGKPVVLLYAAAFAKKVDAALLPETRRRFRKAFDCDLYIVKKAEWPGPADSVYQWGAALMPQLLATAAVGPGYDHSAVEGRWPLVRKRLGGRFYRWSWEKLLAMDPAARATLVHVETWNEFHEGTEICESLEYGRQYIELTRRYAEMFRAGKRIERPIAKPVPAVVSVTARQTDGIRVVPQQAGDGPVVVRTAAGRAALSTAPNNCSPTHRYLYFDVDDLFAHDTDEPVIVTISYCDDGAASFALEYDSADPKLTGPAQTFRAGGAWPIAGTKKWKQITLTLPHARFAGRTNGVDFRLSVTGGDLAVGHIAIRRPKPTSGAK